MEPLRTGDPSRLGRYRLLRRLGAGGMGVVFLARAPGGAIAAVKVVRASYAEETGFRARFRREIEVARRVDSPWVVPLLDADAEAETPWLATAYVPGPSLAETVDAFGPLSLASVHTLGRRLAEALDAMHGIGLVHRDVKPGNILLAPDGPRLIDFGIARAPDATALTSSGVIVGSPGFLSPEQARARAGEIGPSSDVFSLGCVLAFAATGVRPFGGGAAAGMLLRTVYDDPDPTAIPEPLAPLLQSCLHKAPADRPTLAQLQEALAEGTREDAPEHANWLPEQVTRLINERSATVLAIGAIEPTQVPKPTTGVSPEVTTPTTEVSPEAATLTAVTTAPRPTAPPAVGRRALLLGSTAGVLAAGGGGGWWWSSRRKTGGTTSTSEAPPRPELTVAFQGDLTGAQKEYGNAQLNGARLAAEQVNADGTHPFRVKLLPHDDGGDPKRSSAVAARLTKDANVLAVLGPTTDACLLSAHPTYAKATMPVLSVSVGVDMEPGSVGSGQFPSHALLRVTNELLAAPCTRYLSNHVDAQKAFLIADQAQGDSAWNLCDQAQRALDRAGRDATLKSVSAGRIDYASLAAEVLAADADAVAFTGDATRAAGLASALKSAGFTGTRMATERAFDPRFLASAGAAATGWVFATSFIDPTAAPSTRAFAADYRTRFGTAPGWYAAEAYDAVMFLTAVCTKDGTAVRERGAIARRLREVTYTGVSRTLKFETGYGFNHDAMFVFQVVDGRFRYLGQYKDAAVS
ncbi:bifunctional serine/threonine-protein kinase/ABC transporter substrate-binding protein [Streptomyces sp. NPDC020951]|uniref:bifunctional serine/threonine-protein kinase/ABC transporter substrate-binding protein n=1 Tax=Streptomyces sp. NPDC020951 TaxID=3365104 RepID=UPI003791641C